MGGYATLPQGLQQDLRAAEEPAKHHVPSQKAEEAAEPLCPRAWGHHPSGQWALAGAEEPSLEKRRAQDAAGGHRARLVSPRVLHRHHTPTHSYLLKACQHS